MATGQHARNRTQASVEPQLAHQQEAAQIVDAQRAISAENADGNGQIEPGAFLLQVGGRQVDGDVRGRNQVAGVLDGGAHAVAALPHRRVGQPHGVKMILVGHNATVIDFHVDQVGINTVDCSAEGLEEHSAK